MDVKDIVVVVVGLLGLAGVVINVLSAVAQQNKRAPNQNRVDDASTLEHLANTINVQATVQEQQAEEDKRLRDKIVRLQADVSSLAKQRRGPFRITVDLLIGPEGAQVLNTDVALLATGELRDKK